MNLQVVIGEAATRINGIINLSTKLLREPCKQCSSLVYHQLWYIESRMVYLPRELIVSPIKTGIIHLCVDTSTFLIIELICQICHTHYVDSANAENIMHSLLNPVWADNCPPENLRAEE